MSLLRRFHFGLSEIANGDRLLSFPSSRLGTQLLEALLRELQIDVPQKNAKPELGKRPFPSGSLGTRELNVE